MRRGGVRVNLREEWRMCDEIWVVNLKWTFFWPRERCFYMDMLMSGEWRKHYSTSFY